MSQNENYAEGSTGNETEEMLGDTEREASGGIDPLTAEAKEADHMAEPVHKNPEENASKSEASDTAPKAGKENEPEKQSGEKKPKKELRFSLWATTAVVLLAVLLTFQVTYLSIATKYERRLNEAQLENNTYKKLQQVIDFYERYYINPLDEEQIVDGMIEGFIYGAGDKYGSYMNAEEYRAYRENLDGESQGIGIAVVNNEEYDAIEIVMVYKDSPAAEAGVEVGDLIVSVDGVRVADKGYNAVVELLRGSVGSTANFTVLRGENYATRIDFAVMRRSYELQTVQARMFDDEIALISISNFYAGTADELKAAIPEMQENGAKKIIFDLRGNSGGLLTSILDSLDYLLPEGTIVRVKDASGKEQIYTSDADEIDMPMVILVNERTASAAELFTSAMRDYEKADVVGVTTYGKGTVCSMRELGDGSVINVSTMLYYPPYSDNFEGVGITPDHVVELAEEYKNISLYKLTYEQDAQLQKAVELIRGK